ncbi:MAG: VOC family protein [Holophaga sp.]|nr:VOC family protein [Holophaga sp.]
MFLAFQLHHIGLLVRSIERATEAQVARYGYRIESPIIHDPVQTARVRFLRLPQGAHWLELVSPEDGRSRLAGALEKRGEGLHHLCYQVPRLADACAELRDGGQLLLAEPVPAAAFGGRPIAWFMDRSGLLTELVEAGPGPLSLPAQEP